MLRQFNPGDRLNSFGNHLILGVSGTVLSELDRKLLSALQPAGIILFKKNFLQDQPYETWHAALVKLVAECAKYAERPRLLVTIDHEGGRVHRTPPPITHFPPAMRYAARAREVGAAMGLELASLGVQLSFSPCADVHSNPKNPVIGERALGTSPGKAADAAVEYLQGLESEKVLGCAKHFPGHGDTSVDSHHELPILDLPRAMLLDRELIPFQALIEAGVPLVMSAHVKYLQLDPHYPATMSEPILGDLLRKTLGFGGAIVSDDLDMKAVAEAMQKPEHAGRAIAAGLDLLIISRNPNHDSEHPLGIVQALGKALLQRVCSEAALGASHRRLEELFAKITWHAPKLLGEETLEAHQELRRSVA